MRCEFVVSVHALRVMIRKGEAMTVQEVRQHITEYVRSNELQDNDNKRFCQHSALLRS